MNFRERVLSTPLVYKSFKSVISPMKNVRRIVDDVLRLPKGAQVLDLGCGYGDFATVISKNSHYLGIDINENYITVAKRLNRNSNAEFLCTDLSDGISIKDRKFDVILIIGVLHHLDSTTCQSILTSARSLLNPFGELIAMEPIFHPNQKLFARLIIASDRGRFIRDGEGYERLFSDCFKQVETTIHSNLLRIPYTHAVMRARN